METVICLKTEVSCEGHAFCNVPLLITIHSRSFLRVVFAFIMPAVKTIVLVRFEKHP